MFSIKRGLTMLLLIGCLAKGNLQVINLYFLSVCNIMPGQFIILVFVSLIVCLYMSTLSTALSQAER